LNGEEKSRSRGFAWRGRKGDAEIGFSAKQLVVQRKDSKEHLPTKTKKGKRELGVAGKEGGK